MQRVVLFWIWFCAGLNGAGWALSAIHQLNAAGYAVALAIGVVVFLCWRKVFCEPRARGRCGTRFQRRFRRPFPAAWLVLAGLAILGGVLYPPTNYDGLAYRVPRVLHWLADERWHWIHTSFPRLNTRACGIEWVSAPLLALFKTDRLLFLINAVSFVMLPGLVFSVFTRLGVRPRVAWYWMWIVPTGYCFLLQAGSIANDMFSAVLVLAAVDFALRTRTSGAARDFLTSILAAGLMTGGKLSNLPLLLPWGICFLPSLHLIRRWPLRTAMVCLLAALVSIVPISLLNVRYCGDWSGLSTEGVGMKDVLVQFGANAALITSDNLVPPVFPVADKWNQMVASAIPEKLAVRLSRTMEGVGARLGVNGEMQIEENAGLGFGVSALLLVSVVAVLFAPRKGGRESRVGGSRWQTAARWSAIIPLLALMTQSNVVTPGRIVTPFYALLLPIVLAFTGHEQLVRRRWWRWSAFAVFLIAAVPTVISPPRPLFPAQTILSALHSRGVGSRLMARAQIVYSTYARRNDAFAPARAALPPGLKVLGLVTYDDPETSMWRPFGSRRVEHVCPGDTPADLKGRGVEYLLMKPEEFALRFSGTQEQWFQQMNARVIRKIPLQMKAATPEPVDWYLIQLQ